MRGYLSANGQMSTCPTLTTTSSRDKTSTASWHRKISTLRCRVKPLGWWYIFIVSIEVTESTTRGNSSHFTLQIPRFLVLPICSTAPSCPSQPSLYFFFRTSFFHKHASFPCDTILQIISSRKMMNARVICTFLFKLTFLVKIRKFIS